MEKNVSKPNLVFKEGRVISIEPGLRGKDLGSVEEYQKAQKKQSKEDDHRKSFDVPV